MTDSSQTNLFDQPTDPDLIPPPGSEVLSKELSDKWQQEFYSTPIARTESISTKKKKAPLIRPFPRPNLPSKITRSWMLNYLGKTLHGKMVKVMFSTEHHCTALIYQFDINGRTEYAYDFVHVDNAAHANFYLNLFDVTSDMKRQKALSGDYPYHMSVQALFSYAIRRGDVDVDITPVASSGYLDLKLSYHNG